MIATELYDLKHLPVTGFIYLLNECPILFLYTVSYIYNIIFLKNKLGIFMTGS